MEQIVAHGTCKFVKSKIVGSLTNFSVVSLDEDQIATNLVKNGPFVGSYLFSVNKRTCSTYLYPTPQRNYRYIYLIVSYFKRTSHRDSWCAQLASPPPKASSPHPPVVDILVSDGFVVIPHIAGGEVLNRVAAAALSGCTIVTRNVPKHPNIVSLRDTYEEINFVHLVIELCKGSKLFEETRSTASSPMATIRITGFADDGMW